MPVLLLWCVHEICVSWCDWKSWLLLRCWKMDVELALWDEASLRQEFRADNRKFVFEAVIWNLFGGKSINFGGSGSNMYSCQGRMMCEVFGKWLIFKFSVRWRREKFSNFLWPLHSIKMKKSSKKGKKHLLHSLIKFLMWYNYYEYFFPHRKLCFRSLFPACEQTQKHSISRTRAKTNFTDRGKHQFDTSIYTTQSFSLSLLRFMSFNGRERKLLKFSCVCINWLPFSIARCGLKLAFSCSPIIRL